MVAQKLNQLIPGLQLRESTDFDFIRFLLLTADNLLCCIMRRISGDKFHLRFP